MVRESNKKRIFVGLSGGVDSSVSAALLKDAGHDVTGVFIKVWQPDNFPCTWREDRQDAMRVCAKLDIPFETLDLEDVYKREVVDYMIREYKAGRTPNPDVMCNKQVKFGAFLNWARERGADGIATGHYVRILPLQGGKMREMPNDKNRMTNRDLGLYAGVDANKDQSYFLWTLKQKDLSFIYFPVGGFEKDETRRLAKQFGLVTAEKKDSQGLCFIGKLDIKEFLAHEIPHEVGEVVDTKGTVIGEHDGVLFYTLGERHGFRITVQDARGPFYVVAKDLDQNQLTVSHEPHDAEFTRSEITITDTNWIGELSQNTEYLARIRYRGDLLRVALEVNNDTAIVHFPDNQPLVSRGQSLVVYEETSQGLRCVGGGIIN